MKCQGRIVDPRVWATQVGGAVKYPTWPLDCPIPWILFPQDSFCTQALPPCHPPSHQHFLSTPVDVMSSTQSTPVRTAPLLGPAPNPGRILLLSAEHSSLRNRDLPPVASKGKLITRRPTPNLDRHSLLDQRSHSPLEIQATKTRKSKSKQKSRNKTHAHQRQTQKLGPTPIIMSKQDV